MLIETVLLEQKNESVIYYNALIFDNEVALELVLRILDGEEDDDLL